MRKRAPTEADANTCKIILLATSKGRKAIHPPASGSSPAPGAGHPERDVELSGSVLVRGGKRRQPHNPHSPPCGRAGATVRSLVRPSTRTYTGCCGHGCCECLGQGRHRAWREWQHHSHAEGEELVSQIKGALTEADTLALRALWLSLSSLLFRLSL